MAGNAPIVVDSKRPAVPTGITVAANETWRFAARGVWTDWFFACGPDGYENRLADVLGIHPIFPDAPWFSLIGRIAGEPASAFAIGRGVEHTFEMGGALEVFANDMPGFYWNNQGAVRLTAHRLARPPAARPAPSRLPLAARVAKAPPVRPAPAAPPPAGGLAGSWAWLIDLAEKTRGIPFIGVLVVATGLVLAVTDIGQDLVVAVAQDINPQAFVLPLAVTFFALQAWFWSRLIVVYSYGAEREHWSPRGLLTWAPRVLGVAVFVFVLSALWLSPHRDHLQPLTIGLLLLSGLIFLIVVMFREDVVNRLSRSSPAIAWRLASDPGEGRRRWVQASFLLAAVFWLFATFLPVAASQAVGPPATVYLAVASIVPVMATLIHVERLTRLPITGSLFVLAVACSLMPWADNHTVGRRAPFAIEQPPAQPTTSVADALRAWTAVQASAIGAAKSPTPIIFVTAEGGASRAGFWTAATLGELQDLTQGRFSNSVFAITSVSGGSVGALGFVASMDDPRAIKGDGLKTALEDFAGRDFLSPTLAGLLFPDLTQRFLPYALLPDRAETLERSWENAWADHCRGEPPSACDPDRLRRPFQALWGKAPPWRPALAIEGAGEESGRRVVISNLQVDETQIDIDDFHAQTGRDLLASTAIMNGARYPWVSPPGLYDVRRPLAGTAHVVDGGYFDATGLEFTRELANATLKAADSPPPGVIPPTDLRPVFLVIGTCKDAKPKPPSPAELLSDLTAPVVGLFGGRDAHASHISSRLLQDLQGGGLPPSCPTAIAQGEIDGRAALFVPIKLCTIGGENVPLDWVLSAHAKQLMDAALDPAKSGCPDAARNLQVLAGILNGKGWPAPPPTAPKPAAP
ncbi:MAG TPA: hypothetical protein VMT68_19320 [Caulobacteraceae bacterium]|nr:hypothetical protein [Caulobacteraceae bacterium]